MRPLLPLALAAVLPAAVLASAVPALPSGRVFSPLDFGPLRWLPAGTPPVSGVVVYNGDGDTLVLRLEDGSSRKVRLYGVDAPESAQPYGPEAGAFTRASAYGRPVTVRARAVDAYDRLVGVVVLPDGRQLNRELVRAGLAWWYRYFAPDQAGDYGRLEEEARAARAGLWAQDDPEPPWDYRRRNRRD